MNKANGQKDLPSPTEAHLEPGFPVFPVHELFRGTREVRLRHDGQEYRLRLTKRNKLILTK